MKITAILALCLISSACAPLQHAAQQSARLACTDHAGTPIPLDQRHTGNCWAGTYAEQICEMHRRNPTILDIRNQCLQTQISASGTVSSHTVILPQGSFVVTRTGNITSVTQTGRSR